VTAGRLVAGRYRLEEKIGRGGMGTVWRARDDMLGRIVAVKEIRFPAGIAERERADLCERSVREARAAAVLSHPSIITVHDVLYEEGRPWIVMDLVEGRSLEDVRTADGPLPAQVVARIGLELLDALSLAHRHGVLHRDVKPGNVLVDSDFHAILTDFGIATVAADRPASGSTGLVGSPGYMPPERLMEADIGPSSDLWSLGATLYTAVEGEPPFSREGSLAVLGAVLTQHPAPPRRAGPLAPALLAMLAKDPATRPDPAMLREVFQAVAAGTAVANCRMPAFRTAAPPPAPRYGTPAPRGQGPGAAPSSRRWAAPAVVAVSAVLVAVLSGVLIYRGTATWRDAQGPLGPHVAGTADPYGPGRTAGPVAGKAPDACSLLTPAQAGQVTGAQKGRPSGSTGCSWGDLTITVRSFGDGRDTAQAEKSFDLFHRQAANKPGLASDPASTTRTSRPEAVAGLGDEAFVQDKRTEGVFYAAWTHVIVRSGSVILDVEMNSIDESEDVSRIRGHAMAAARLAVDSVAGR
jgi:hypothetical protein